MPVLSAIVAFTCGAEPPPAPNQPPSAATEPVTAALILPYLPPDTTPILPLTLPSKYFDVNKAVITPAAAAVLDGILHRLRGYPSATIRIEGNCEDQGSHKDNLILGMKRGKTAMEHLLKSGIESSRIAAVSNVETNPIISGQGNAARAQNWHDDFGITSQ